MYCFLKISHRLWGLPRLPLNAYREFCPRVERSKSGEINHSPPATTQLKNEWNYIAYFFTRLHGVQGENFTVLPFTHKWAE